VLRRGLGSGAIAGIVVVAVVAIFALAAAFFFYRRWKSVQAASQDLYRIHTPQRPSVIINTGASSSVETRSNASLVRNDISSPGTSWRSYQQPENDYQAAQRGGRGRHAPGSSDSRMPTVGEVISSSIQSSVDEVQSYFHFMIDLIRIFLQSGNTRRPLPDAPGSQLNIFQQPVPDESLGIAKTAPAQHRVSMQSTSATVSDLPPNYIQATR
jgi:hypothetical protein